MFSCQIRNVSGAVRYQQYEDEKPNLKRYTTLKELYANGISTSLI